MKKKIMRLIALLLVIFIPILAACSAQDVQDIIDNNTRQIQLAAPTNLRVDAGYLRWNPVEYATRYIVSVDDSETYCDDYQYSLSAVNDGDRRFKVKACGDGVLYKSSEFSLEYEVTLLEGAATSGGYYSQFDDLTKEESFLGYGFDVINSSMFNDQVVKTSFPIFKNDELLKQRLLKVDSKKSNVEEIASSSMETFMQDWNASLNVDVSWGKKKIGGSVGVEAKYSGGSDKAKSKYYHVINIKNQKFYIVMQSDLDTYREIVTDSFKKDLLSDMDPASLFSKYGTHFITSAVMGGQISSYYLYTSDKETSFNDISAKVSVDVRYAVGKTDVGAEGGYRQFAENENIFIKNTLEVIGGSDFGMLSDADISKNYLAWEKSLDDHASLMGIKDTGSLVPIWDLIDSASDTDTRYTWTDENGNTNNGTRKQQLEGYFLSYGVENYNSLLAATGLPEITVPQKISNVAVNMISASDDSYEVYAGVANDITFNVEPYNATGYNKNANITTSTSYVTINKENGLQIDVSPNAPNGLEVDIVLSAGNVRKQITVRVVRRYTVRFVTNCSTELSPITNIIHGSQIDRPTGLYKRGQYIEGWYKDPSFDEASLYVFGSHPVLESFTLYAKWADGTSDTPDTPTEECITIDMSVCYENNAVDLSKFKHDSFNSQSGVFTINDSTGSNATAYVFRGKYATAGNETATIEGFSICLATSYDVKIILENISFVGATGYPAIFRCHDIGTSDYHDTLYIQDSPVKINGSTGYSAISCDSISVLGDGSVDIIGGDVNNDESISSAAIYARKDIAIDFTGDISFYGGNGQQNAVINGAPGLDGRDVSIRVVGSAKVSGGNGASFKGNIASKDQVGKKGGNGGAGIVCSNCTLLSSSISVCGGNGGDGGKAGFKTFFWSSGSYGETGGDGGNGGDGIIYIYTASAVNKTTLYGGCAGSGGLGGDIHWRSDSSSDISYNVGKSGANGSDGETIKKATLS